MIKNDPRECHTWKDEIFGPVATIHTFKTFDEALEMANDSRYGLQAGVFTRDVGNAKKAGETLEFGGVLSTRCRPSAPTRCPTAASRTRATPARAPTTRFMS